MTRPVTPRNQGWVDTSWHPAAACSGMDVGLFYPADRTRGEELRHQVKRAKAVCRSGCPVIRDCLAHALDYPEVNGIWAATTWEERKRIRRSRTRRRGAA